MSRHQTITIFAAFAALALGGCHFDDEAEGLPEVGTPEAGMPDAAPGCEEGAVEACAIIDGCSGERTCVAGVFGDCIAPPERCDGADNDCDGETDEGYAGLGETCSTGEGACAADGVNVCVPSGDAVACDATAGQPGDEVCNGLDDDCDGTTDEDFGGGQPCETGQAGVCAAGMTICGDDGTRCVAGAEPSDELCDGLDNDCDGATDEGEDGSLLTRDCYDGPADTVGNGPCLGGTQTCEAGVYGACVGQVLPGVEICDGLDNNCSGESDDVDGGCACLPGETRDCYSGPEGTAGVGACQMGTQTCLEDGSTYGPCDGEVVPAVEVCATRAQDLDCDGDTDDVPGTGEACSAGVGACLVDGVTACGADDIIACTAVAGMPSDEICDGIDNDCDGAVDDVATLGEACALGVGACAADGVRVCDLDEGAVVCNAAEGAPVVEICDGIDNDCNGVVDDVAGLGDACEVGVGACLAAGSRVCDLDAGALVCDAVAGAPSAEVCDGIDNDCDGMADDVAGIGEACEVGAGACLAAGVRICDLGAGAVVCDAVAGQPGAEVCDGIDNDCNGTADDLSGLGDACTVGVGACAVDGTRVCDMGTGALTCDAVAGQPGDETCDGLDNDCNGTVDDVEGVGDVCQVGVGACLSVGARICNVDLGTLVCDAIAGGGQQEICDGIDNDCDGEIDDVDGLGDACSVGQGVCQRNGTRVCDLGARQVVCDAQPGNPQNEICDGLDNNCNGEVDDVAGRGDACSAGTGGCARNGTRVCDVPGRQLVCNAQPGNPQNEICDGVDNNCNGQVDDVAGLGAACSAGTGACQRNGTRVCDVGAQQLVCNAQPGNPQNEICDNIDNNCNGQVDDVAGLGAACTAGQGICQRNGTNVCNVPARQLVCSAQPGPSGNETCDNRDEDCDGRTDENVTQQCYPGPGGTQNVGTCRGGTQTCNAGNFGACQGAVTPIAEFCSGQDNNCNGQIDDVYAEFDARDFAADQQCFDFALGDINRNGRADVVCSLNANDGRLAYWHDAGPGNFGAVRYAPAAPIRSYKVEMADLDRDGDNDVVGVGPFMPPQVWINNNGNLAAPVAAFNFDFGGGPTTSGLALADMTGDGIIDIVASIGAPGDPASWRLAIARGNGNGTFQAAATPATGPDLYDIQIGDIDQDGDLDVMAMSGLTAGIFRNNGGGNYANYQELIAFPNYPQKSMYTDFTGDGRADWVIGTEARWFFGRAQGNGFAFVETADRGTLMAVGAADLDCDPLPEIVMTRSNPGSPIVIVGEPPTQSRVFERFSAHGWSLEGADINADGLDDLILPRANGGGFYLLTQRP